jgi:hypothetical protein
MYIYVCMYVCVYVCEECTKYRIGQRMSALSHTLLYMRVLNALKIKWGSKVIAPRIIKLDTRWGSAVNLNL